MIDAAFIAFLSLSLAAIFLALVIGVSDVNVRQVGRKVGSGLINASKAPITGKADAARAVMRKTEIADAAMAARRRGERFVPPRDLA